jgi:hypothetical protein
LSASQGPSYNAYVARPYVASFAGRPATTCLCPNQLPTVTLADPMRLLQQGASSGASAQGRSMPGRLRLRRPGSHAVTTHRSNMARRSAPSGHDRAVVMRQCMAHTNAAIGPGELELDHRTTDSGRAASPAPRNQPLSVSGVIQHSRIHSHPRMPNCFRATLRPGRHQKQPANEHRPPIALTRGQDLSNRSARSRTLPDNRPARPRTETRSSVARRQPRKHQIEGSPTTSSNTEPPHMRHSGNPARPSQHTA